jgi:hypothetical protein
LENLDAEVDINRAWEIISFMALENLDAQMDINRAWETARENIKISVKESLGYYELKKHKSRFNERCSKL